PIEDNPNYDWDDYKQNYLQTLIAGLLYPEVYRYEVCPWPNRVFNAKYRQVGSGYLTLIPDDYSTLLNSLFQLLGNMNQKEYYYEKNNDIKIGVAVSDTTLYQRSFPSNSSFSEI